MTSPETSSGEHTERSRAGLARTPRSAGGRAPTHPARAGRSRRTERQPAERVLVAQRLDDRPLDARLEVALDERVGLRLGGGHLQRAAEGGLLLAQRHAARLAAALGGERPADEEPAEAAEGGAEQKDERGGERAGARQRGRPAPLELRRSAAFVAAEVLHERLALDRVAERDAARPPQRAPRARCLQARRRRPRSGRAGPRRSPSAAVAAARRPSARVKSRPPRVYGSMNSVRPPFSR